MLNSYVYFNNGIEKINDDFEFISLGRQNAIVLYVKRCDDLAAFSADMMSKPISFENKTLRFLNLTVSKEQKPCPRLTKTFDTPFISSDWRSKHIELKSLMQTKVYD